MILLGRKAGQNFAQIVLPFCLEASVSIQRTAVLTLKCNGTKLPLQASWPIPTHPLRYQLISIHGSDDFKDRSNVDFTPSSHTGQEAP
jgi:hypothetical protein